MKKSISKKYKTKENLFQKYYNQMENKDTGRTKITYDFKRKATNSVDDEVDKSKTTWTMKRRYLRPNESGRWKENVK